MNRTRAGPQATLKKFCEYLHDDMISDGDADSMQTGFGSGGTIIDL